MNIHQNARLTPSGRERLVRLSRSGLAPKAVAETMGVCVKTVRKWVARFDAEGVAGLQDRSSRPRTLYRPTSAETQAGTVRNFVCVRRIEHQVAMALEKRSPKMMAN